MKLSQLLENVSLLRPISQDIEITGIAYDSRRVKPGSLFVCIKGYVTDGHSYIENARKNGAAAILAQDEVPDVGLPILYAQDTRKALAQVSAAFYDHPEKKLKLVAVTGTNGKTTVTTLIKSVLEFSGKVVGLIGTNENQIGSRTLPAERTTPESLELFALFDEMVREGAEYAVMEVSSHSLFLHRVYGITFDIAVFTNLTQDHLDFHETMENYYLAKRMLFDVCKTGVVNADDEAGKRIAKEAACPVITYSIDTLSDFQATDIKVSPRGVIFNVSADGQTFSARLGIPGKFSVYNALAALAACISLSIPPAKIADALLVAKGVKGRAETVYTRTDYTILIDYAHTPDGLENIIKTVKDFATGRVVTLFGCGGDRDPVKRPIMGEIAGQLSDFCIITSDNPRTEAPMSIIEQIEAGMKRTACAYTVIENRREAISYAIETAQPGDCIILAGKGHETYQIIGTEKRHFDEREVIQEILAEREKANTSADSVKGDNTI
ncbi:MAG: UDP-N-acetylmuramoyl-L-alanyl-D-glutamate--2,6-diaminopimelate ligase [Ruminococcaceae bacterium]|nr:UDP-N-acetylmuramoyl-L-alanyl-D-glutamate--2,6-diaminopimelate ligase [Oscillospiraceae bacterium]